jgi:hypothetical protein
MRFAQDAHRSSVLCGTGAALILRKAWSQSNESISSYQLWFPPINPSAAN